MTVLGHEGDTTVERLEDTPARHLASAGANRSGRRAAQPDHGLGHRHDAAAADTRQPDDLVRFDGERDLLELAGPAEPVDGQHRLDLVVGGHDPRGARDARDEAGTVIVCTRSRVVIVDTGAVTMCRASRSTVTVWQMSKISCRWWEM